MKLLALILISSTIIKSCGDSKSSEFKLSKETDRIVSKIEKVNELMGSAVGYSGTKPIQFDNFIELENKSSKEELIALTDHSNGVVRCYAFWALSHDSTIDLLPIILKHINDKELVNTQFGCIGGAEKVGDFLISVVTPHYVDLSSKKLDSLQFMKLDSILVHSNSELDAKSTAISRAKQTDDLYNIIRELITEKKNPSAIVTLAKYRRKQDIPLILNSKYNDSYYFTFQAIKEFPDPEFLPFLEKSMLETFDDTHYSSEWRVMYSAIAQYKNIKALELLKRPFTETKVPEIRTYHMDFIFGALQESKAPIFDDLLWSLWQNENKISVTVYKHLSKTNPVKAYDLTKKTLLNSDALYASNISFDSENENNSENLVSIMLDLAIQQDREFGFEIIRKNIKEMSVHLFPIFADKAADLKDNSFIEPLFQRLEVEWNAHVYLKAAETLIKYNDTKINQRILLTKKKNKNLSQDWGGEAFDKLLKENNIK